MMLGGRPISGRHPARIGGKAQWHQAKPGDRPALAGGLELSYRIQATASCGDVFIKAR